MTQTKCIVKFGGREFRIRVIDPCSVSALQHKIRRYLKLDPTQACFLFFEMGYFNRERMFSGSKLVSQIMVENYGAEFLIVNVLLENTFGSLDRRFISATITELANSGAWTLKVKYSFYNLYEYSDIFVYKSQQECERKLLVERTHGYLTIIDKNSNPVNIEPVE